MIESIRYFVGTILNSLSNFENLFKLVVQKFFIILVTYGKNSNLPNFVRTYDFTLNLTVSSATISNFNKTLVTQVFSS